MNATAVIVARQFNPSIVRDNWLIQHGIIEADDLQPGCVFTDMLVQLRSRQFHLLVAPEQCQFTPLVAPNEQQHLVVEKVGTIVRTLPHTPYTALGLNFQWHLTPENATVEELGRRLFFVPESPIHRELDSADARFGGYISKDALGFRLRLNAKPIMQVHQGQERHLVQFGFNFHLELPDNQDERIDAIEVALNRWNEAQAESERLSQLATTEDVNG
ncbi:MAG: hypothetical protein RJS97_08750 [Parvibaculaceae bacterium]